MLRGRACWAALALLAVGWTLPARASLTVPVELKQLAGDSTHVVRGRVAGLESRWNADHTLIETEVRLEVKESLKGDTRGEIFFIVPGGQVGDLVLAVSASPRLAEEDDILVFARRQADGTYVLPYLSVGTYHLRTDARGTWVQGSGYSLARLLPSRASSLDAAERLPWEQFRSDLLQAMKTTSGGAR